MNNPINVIYAILEECHRKDEAQLKEVYAKIRKTIELSLDFLPLSDTEKLIQIWRESKILPALHLPHIRKILMCDEELKENLLLIIKHHWEEVGNRLKAGNKAATFFIALRDIGIIENNQTEFIKRLTLDFKFSISLSGMNRAISENRLNEKEVTHLKTEILKTIKSHLR